MAKLKIDIRKLEKEVGQRIDKRMKKVKREWAKKTIKMLKFDVRKLILSGKSPVAGKGRFKKYSDSYKQSMGKKKPHTTFRTIGGKVVPLKGADPEITKYGKQARPVNLKLSGKMLRSIKGRETRNGLVVWFASKIAKYHDKLGAGKSKVIRRMLPDSNEKLIRKLQNKVQEIFRQSFRNAFK